ncbi:MAG: 50S ribosomal protein L21 [Planctomycetota bacterium]|jgi:large subunit ribosomal protein L21
MYAIIEDHGRQYTVREGDVIRVDLKDMTEKEQLTFDRVLMLRDPSSPDAETKVGTPTVSGATVTATVLGELKGKKIVVRKFKRRKNYRRKQGHRQRYTQVRIDSIEG